jgi:hypothetical protein
VDKFTKAYQALLESKSVLEDASKLNPKHFSVASRAPNTLLFIEEALDGLKDKYLECEADHCLNMFLSIRRQRFCCDSCGSKDRGRKFRYRKNNPILAAIDDIVAKESKDEEH